MDKISEIVLTTRRTGNTTWILKSAVKTPDCIIVCKTLRHAKELEKEYFRMLQKSSWWLKLKWNLFGRNHPHFWGVDSQFKGYNLPVIFDNSALFTNGS